MLGAKYFRFILHSFLLANKQVGTFSNISSQNIPALFPPSEPHAFILFFFFRCFGVFFTCCVYVCYIIKIPLFVESSRTVGADLNVSERRETLCWCWDACCLVSLGQSGGSITVACLDLRFHQCWLRSLLTHCHAVRLCENVISLSSPCVSLGCWLCLPSQSVS